MTDLAIIEAIRQVAQIPAERRLWSLATIAEYAELSQSHVAQTKAVRSPLPAPRRPAASGTCGRLGALPAHRA